MTEPANNVAPAPLFSDLFPYTMTDKAKADISTRGLGEPGETRIDELTAEHYRRGVAATFDRFRLLP